MSEKIKTSNSAEIEKNAETKTRGDESAAEVHDLIDLLQEREMDGSTPNGVIVEFEDSTEEKRNRYFKDQTQDSVSVDVERDSQHAGTMRASRVTLHGRDYLSIRFTESDGGAVVGAGRSEDAQTGETMYTFTGEGYKPDYEMTDADVVQAEERFSDLAQDLSMEIEDRIG